MKYKHNLTPFPSFCARTGVSGRDGVRFYVPDSTENGYASSIITIYHQDMLVN
jgi:hypothetical protein